MECLQEIYRVLGDALLDNLKKQNVRPGVYREMILRLDEVCPTNITVPEPSVGSRKQSSGGKEQDTASYDMQGPVQNGSGRLADDTASLHDSGRHVASKKGGYKDAGGAGEVQDVPPIPVASDRELIAELEALVSIISGTSADWQQRIATLMRLEGLAKAAAQTMPDALLEGLRVLKDAIVKQVEDRRSAVEKQACYTLSGLASVLGLRFQDYLIFYLPVLFKVLPITVQVSVSLCCCPFTCALTR